MKICVSLRAFFVSLALVSSPVWAHPHGSASCTVDVVYSGANVSKVNLTLVLDAEHSAKVFESMQTKADGSFSPEQKARMESNLAFIFSPINYLVSLKVNQSGQESTLALRAAVMPTIERTNDARVRISAQLARVDAVSSSENELSVKCADPSWNWLVGFKATEHVTSNRQCSPKLGDAFVFALPSNLPQSDGPSIKVTADHLPKSQVVTLVCA
jgi:ABC-type uncharacterized transport system substrate-binding protein